MLLLFAVPTSLIIILVIIMVLASLTGGICALFIAARDIIKAHKTASRFEQLNFNSWIMLFISIILLLTLGVSLFVGGVPHYLLFLNAAGICASIYKIHSYFNEQDTIVRDLKKDCENADEYRWTAVKIWLLLLLGFASIIAFWAFFLFGGVPRYVLLLDATAFCLIVYKLATYSKICSKLSQKANTNLNR